ncbi:DUF4421 domain-containing protein [Arachidicoccus terrestris]|uniref:DUF4421 domain-containing protein n=1 Tax=Arachidicoccus terrestris TaxID=2875539 RepID=UPI001CC649BD|nr:DUF4421 domain-containing protein [Arachidicoccus terrestris]UAY56169.1 DUF4421 domain-containing protein [Arachidicoccus terrestris]
MSRKTTLRKMFWISCLMICASQVKAQHSFWSYLGRSHDQRDSSYILDYGNDITGRMYYTRENTGLTFRSSGQPSFDYKPNNSKGLGLGLSYRYLTLNLSFRLLGTDKQKGKTNSLSLQTSLYKQQWVYDFVYQHFKGMYLSPKELYNKDGNYYLRPDVRSTLVGGDFWRILNSDRFSYRAVMTQNEWQIKSAGSLLLGGEIYYGNSKADSTLVPAALAEVYPQSGIDNIRFFRIGAGIGYAYTYVFQKHFFVSGGVTGILDYATTRESRGEDFKGVNAVSPNISYRLSIGYNSRLYNINASMFNNSVPAHSAAGENYNLFDQQFRITVARRFSVGHKMRKKIFNPVDKQLDKVEDKVKKLQGK